LQNSNKGALIGAVGEPAQTLIFLGDNGSIWGPFAGQVWVAINDDWYDQHGAGYADNQGTITIQVDTPGTADAPRSEMVTPKESFSPAGRVTPVKLFGRG
jgi:hypothetical protein